MGEFFKGWRRKTGCVTLVMAVVFVGLCVRSFEISDEISFTFNGGRHYMTSFIGGLQLESLFGENPGPVIWSPVKVGSCQETDPNQERLPGEVFGFYFGRTRAGIDVCEVPLWFPTFSLTLLSAYLLLSKPRIAKPKKAVEADRGTVNHE